MLIYGSKIKALRGVSFLMAVLGGCTYYAWTHPLPPQHTLAFILARYAVPLMVPFILIAPIRILLGHPLLTVGERGVTSFYMFTNRFTPWAEVRGLVVAPLKAGRRSLPAIQILTSGRPIVLTQSLLAPSLEEVQRTLLTRPEFQHVIAQATSRAS